MGLGVKYVRAIRTDRTDENWQREKEKILAEFKTKSEKINRKEIAVEEKDHTILSKQSLTKKININNATSAELQLLPRIGPAIAEGIITFRREHGPFHSIDEIQNVKNIGPKTFEKIKDFITIE